MPKKTDLSYPARSIARRDLLLKNIENINESLKLEKVGVTLFVQGESLILRYTDPSKTRKKISPAGVNLSPTGVDLARSLALRIGAAIQGGYYDDTFLNRDIYRVATNPVAAEPLLTWDTVMGTFAVKWLKYREGDASSTDRQKKRTLNNYLCQIGLANGLLSPRANIPFDASLIKQMVDLHAEGTDKRFRLRETLSIVCTLFGVAYDFKNIGKRPKPVKREIPSDDEIIKIYKRFDSIYENMQANHDLISCHKWLYGVLATYGLRPQELFAIDLGVSFKAANDYWIVLDERLCDGLKTGSRTVAPLHPKWVQEFDLTNVQYPPIESADVTRRVKQLGEYWRIHSVGITPYALRHAYAIRCRRLGIELLDAADLMGHDPQTHHRQYHRWIGDDDRRESIRNALDRNKSSESL
jgi:integrase